MIGDYYDLNLIAQDVERVIKHSQAFHFDLNCGPLIEQWAKAKENLFELFGNTTLLFEPRTIATVLSPELRSRKFKDFLKTLNDNAVLTTSFQQFLLENEKTFFENKVSSAYKARGIKEGQKLSRAFKEFIYDDYDLRWVQDTASLYMQQNKLEGVLFLSIDPLDFLTISENNNNWDSCHRLDGAERSGNLSYMVDEVTAVAYLADPAWNSQLKMFPSGRTWNNKIWRMLVHIGENCIYFNKQYPFENSALAKKVFETIANRTGREYTEMMHVGYNAVGGSYGWSVLDSNCVDLGGRPYSTKDLVDTSEYTGYCDIQASTTYSPIAALDLDKFSTYPAWGGFEQEYKSVKDLLGIKIGNLPICPVCGKRKVEAHGHLLCKNCMLEYHGTTDFFPHCYTCGRRLWRPEDAVWRDGEAYCKKCEKENINGRKGFRSES